MSFVIDICLLGIIIYTGWKGWKERLISSMFGVLAIIVAFYIGSIAATVFSQEFTGLFSPFVSGILESTVEAVVSPEEDEMNADEAEEEKSFLTGGVIVENVDTTSVHEVSFATLRRLGIVEETADVIASNVETKATRVDQEMSDALSDEVCQKASFVMVFSVFFILAAIIFAAIGNIINLKFEIPKFTLGDELIGCIFGVIRGISVVLFITFLFRFLGLFLSEEVLHKTVLAEWLTHSNSIANHLGL